MKKFRTIREVIKNAKSKGVKVIERKIKPEEMKEFVGCELIVQGHKIILHQRKIISKLFQDFDNEIKDLKFKGFPMGNLTKVIRPSDDSKDLLSTQRQLRYQ